MRHPFDGIIQPERPEGPGKRGEPSRRELLKLAVAAGPGLAIAGLASQALGQAATTLAIGEEGGKKPPPKATTKAIGEEGGKRPPPRITTKAIGEEGGGKPGNMATTMAIGEEGAGRPKPPNRAKIFEEQQQAFDEALAAGRVERAADCLKKLNAIGTKPELRAKAVDAQKRLAAKLPEMLQQADADLKAGKLVEAVKAYRAVSRMRSFPEQPKALKKLEDAAGTDGYKEALREVSAQEKYDAVQDAPPAQRPGMLRRIARDFKDTPTGKKAGDEIAQAEAESREAEAARLYEGAKKLPPASRQRVLKMIVSRYGDTPTGKTAAEELKQGAPAPGPGGGPVMTTLAIGEEG